MSTQMRRTTEAGAARQRLVIAAVGATVLANVPGLQTLLVPVRLFVTYIHEGCHAAMALVTGGMVEHIGVMSSGDGLTVSRGGMPFLIYMAGYVGTSAFGALCLMGARREGNGKSVLAFMGMAVLAVTALWTRNGFGMLAGVGVAAALGLLAGLLRGRAADLAAALLSVLLCLNALMDLRTLLLLTTVTDAPNDAVFMSQMFGLPPVIWALVWAAVSLAITWAALKWVWSGGSVSAPRRA
jgi:hypothetical protein